MFWKTDIISKLLLFPGSSEKEAFHWKVEDSLYIFIAHADEEENCIQNSSHRILKTVSITAREKANFN